MRLNSQFSTIIRRFNDFAHARRGPFFQQKPSLGNQYKDDKVLTKIIRKYIPKQHLAAIEQDLTAFGKRVTADIHDLHVQCSDQLPRLEQFDAFGNRIDRLIVSPAWKKLKDISAQEGLISLGYDRKYGPCRRIYQAAKLYMFAPSSGLFSCPLAMTDGAAKVFMDSEYLQKHQPLLRERVLRHLVSSDRAHFWTSGQWMTERGGGSDVAAGTETRATPSGDHFLLRGYKWFTSASDADMALTLARIEDGQGHTKSGTKGLTLFFLEVNDPRSGLKSNLNGIEVQRLKDKLGTKQVPTAELLLENCRAVQASDESRGVAGISPMLTLTRLHNAISSVGYMRRILQWNKSYAQLRTVFGRVLKEMPLHRQTLARMEMETRASCLLLMEAARLLGLDDDGVASEQEEALLRLLTPLAKLYTAKAAVAVVSEGLEGLGGLGYLEDTGFPLYLRDAQVLPIWEGTTNVLSMDVLRCIAKSNGAVLDAYVASVRQKCDSAARKVTSLAPLCTEVVQHAGFLAAFPQQHRALVEVAARDYSLSLSRVYLAALMLDMAAWDEADDGDRAAAVQWIRLNQLNLIKSRLEANMYNDDSDSILDL